MYRIFTEIVVSSKKIVLLIVSVTIK